MKNIIVVISLLSICIVAEIQAQCHEHDWTALKALYESTNGDEWKENEGWEQVKGNTPPNNCNLGIMEGITLEGTPGRVVHLSLPNNNLEGIIPNEIGLLSELVWLNMPINRISGGIPTTIDNLSKLEWLRLEINLLSDSLPSEIGNLHNLLILNLFDNKISGTIPPELSNLTKIMRLELFGNKLTGTIPKEFSNIKKKFTLGLNSNRLTGGIPPEFGDMRFSAFTLYLFDNNLSGCYDDNLRKLCDDFEGYGYGFQDPISPGNGFDATWEEFCKEGKGICDTTRLSPLVGTFNCD